jgi:hypothetical protein
MCRVRTDNRAFWDIWGPCVKWELGSGPEFPEWCSSRFLPSVKNQ